MPTQTTDTRRGWRSPAVLFAIAFSSMLLTLGIPRLGASVAGTYGAPTLSAIKSDRPVTQNQIARLAQSRQWQISWNSDNPEAWLELGLARMLQGEYAGYDSVKGSALLAAARDATEKGLSKNPADGYGWLRLSYLRYLIAGEPVSEAVKPLLRSIEVQPITRSLVIPRLRFAFSTLWPVMTDQDKMAIRHHIAAMAHNDSQTFLERHLADLALSYSTAFNTIRDALADKPESRVLFYHFYSDNQRPITH